MSRAFIREDGAERERDYHLPRKDDPAFDAAAAWALLEGANEGDSLSAQRATGYRWGEPLLKPHIERIRREASVSGNERLVELADRFLMAIESLH